MPATFSVLLLTAAPPGHAVESGGPFVKIDGREALLRSTELFLNRPQIKQIQLVFTPDFMEEGKRKYGGHLSFSGVKLVTAGPRWIDQIAAGAQKLSDEATHVVIHDTARPAVAYSDIDALLEEAEKKPIVVLTSPLRGDLVEIDQTGQPVSVRRSGEFVNLLTPLSFAREKFLHMAQNKQEPHASELCLLKGSPLNMRCSGPADAAFMKSLLMHLPKPKIKSPLSPFEEAQW